MFKRILAISVLALAVVGCSGGQQSQSTADQTQANASTEGFKIGLMTGTVSQNEEEFRAGQQIAAKYGNRVKHVTYPDNFMQEQETVIAQLTGLAADPEVKVIVV